MSHHVISQSCSSHRFIIICVKCHIVMFHNVHLLKSEGHRTWTAVFTPTYRRPTRRPFIPRSLTPSQVAHCVSAAVDRRVYSPAPRAQLGRGGRCMGGGKLLFTLRLSARRSHTALEGALGVRHECGAPHVTHFRVYGAEQTQSGRHQCGASEQHLCGSRAPCRMAASQRGSLHCAHCRDAVCHTL